MSNYQAVKQDGIQLNCLQKRLILENLKETILRISVNKSRQMIFCKNVMGTYQQFQILFQILQGD